MIYLTGVYSVNRWRILLLGGLLLLGYKWDINPYITRNENGKGIVATRGFFFLATFTSRRLVGETGKGCEPVPQDEMEQEYLIVAKKGDLLDWILPQGRKVSGLLGSISKDGSMAQTMPPRR